MRMYSNSLQEGYLFLEKTELLDITFSCNFTILRVKFYNRLVHWAIMGGCTLTSDILVNHQEKAYALLKADADKIFKLIKVQMDNLTMPQCPLYEEVLDTQMFGLSREIDFAVRLGLIEERDGKELLGFLEKELSALHDASLRK